MHATQFIHYITNINYEVRPPSYKLVYKLIIWMFPKSWGYPNSWMVHHGKSQSKMGDLRVPAFQKTPM